MNVKTSVNNQVHHNYIHDNIRAELGYGIVVQNGMAQAEIFCNVLSANRHSIGGSGNDGEGYNAHDNLILPGGYETFWRYSVYIRGTPTDGRLTVSNNIFTRPWNVGK